MMERFPKERYPAHLVCRPLLLVQRVQEVKVHGVHDTACNEFIQNLRGSSFDTQRATPVADLGAA